jgi:MurNAc alpha-1-phosphate uridylyltransferase
MKAMLLAAGRGERMRPLTLEKPKPLLEVGNRPLIVWHLERLAAAGFKDIVINVSWLGQQIEEYCGDGERWGVSIQYSREAEPLETAGGIVRALPLLGDLPFAVINADIWTDFAFQDLHRRHAGSGAHLVLVPNPAHNATGDFSLIDGRVKHAENDTLTYAGVGVYAPAFFEACEPGKRPLKPLLERAIDAGTLCGECFEGRWTDVGTPERLARLNATQLAAMGSQAPPAEER